MGKLLGQGVVPETGVGARGPLAAVDVVTTPAVLPAAATAPKAEATPARAAQREPQPLTELCPDRLVREA